MGSCFDEFVPVATEMEAVGNLLAIDVAQMVNGDLFRNEADRYARDLRANYAPIPGTDGKESPMALPSRRRCGH